MNITRTIILGMLLFTAAGSEAAPDPQFYNKLWSGFSTSLVNRSEQQRHNAAKAAAMLNGMVIMPGGRFSFNEVVGGRESAKGYVAAPIIDEQGLLQDIPGGGICQLSTTIYNAALLAGMKILERHPHSRSVGYVPPGRDATIASWRKDLKFANPHSVPLLLKIELSNNRVTASFWGSEAKSFVVELTSNSSMLEPETAVVRSGEKRNQPGARGYHVITRRLTSKDGNILTEIISDDIYPPPSRLIAGDAP